MCKHQNVERGSEKCYEGHFDVARAAQGGIEWKETCVDCGATRVGWRSTGVTAMPAAGQFLLHKTF